MRLPVASKGIMLPLVLVSCIFMLLPNSLSTSHAQGASAEVGGLPSVARQRAHFGLKSTSEEGLTTSLGHGQVDASELMVTEVAVSRRELGKSKEEKKKKKKKKGKKEKKDKSGKITGKSSYPAKKKQLPDSRTRSGTSDTVGSKERARSKPPKISSKPPRGGSKPVKPPKNKAIKSTDSPPSSPSVTKRKASIPTTPPLSPPVASSSGGIPITSRIQRREATLTAICVMVDDFYSGIYFDKQLFDPSSEEQRSVPYTFAPPSGRTAVTSDCSFLLDANCEIKKQLSDYCDDGNECSLQSCSYSLTASQFASAASAPCFGGDCPPLGATCTYQPFSGAPCGPLGSGGVCDAEGICKLPHPPPRSPPPSPPPPPRPPPSSPPPKPRPPPPSKKPPLPFSPPPSPPLPYSAPATNNWCSRKDDFTSCPSEICLDHDCRCQAGFCVNRCSLPDAEGQQCSCPNPDGCSCHEYICQPFCAIPSNLGSLCTDCPGNSWDCTCNQFGQCAKA